MGRLDKWPPKEQINIVHGIGVISFIAFSPDGRQVALCSNNQKNNTVLVYEVETCRVIAGPFTFTERVLCTEYSTDGKNILSVSRDGTIRTWNIESGGTYWPVEHVTVATDQEVDCAAFSHNRKYIVLARCNWLKDGRTSYISVRNVETGSIVSGPFVARGLRFTCHAFSPDDKSVASGSDDGTIYVWSTQPSELVAGPFKGHEKPVRCISYSHNGTFIVSSSYDCTIRLWEVGRTPPQIQVYKEHTGTVGSVALLSDDRRIVSGSVLGTVLIRDVETRDVVVRRPLDVSVCLDYSIAISPDGKRIASCSSKRVHIWDVETYWERRKFLDGQNGIICLALSNDRRYLVSGSDYGTILYWDVGTGEMVGSLCEGNGVAVFSLAYSPDGKRVVSGYSNGTVRIWEVATGRVEKELSGHENWVDSVAFSNDGRYIASASKSSKTNRIQVWNAETGDCIHALQVEGDDRWQALISFSPDDKYVLSNWENGFRIWDVKTGNLVIKSKQQHDSYVQSMTFSHDGKLVATASEDNTIRLWDARTGKPVLCPFIGHTFDVCSVAFSPDDKLIASGSYDRTVRVWDVSTGQTIMGPLTGHTRQVDLVAFSHDGNSIFSVSPNDKTIRTWSMEQVKPTLFTNELKVDYDGWVKGENDELLFWVPECHRVSLHRPNNTRVVGPNETRINLTKARLGDKWAECYTP